ncbi:hypothetical protein VTL71DRAFT_12763 [Oculimacula yallundae]|uniref:Uncharacterized protein n=1 Tax=Oculimacula yallundae TaxID=86028 RepID=A0ABR4CQA3_9HELO
MCEGSVEHQLKPHNTEIAASFQDELEADDESIVFASPFPAENWGQARRSRASVVEVLKLSTIVFCSLHKNLQKNHVSGKVLPADSGRVKFLGTSARLTMKQPSPLFHDAYDPLALRYRPYEQPLDRGPT